MSRCRPMEVKVLVGSPSQSLGWYDGSGGITTDRSKAFDVVVDGADVEA